MQRIRRYTRTINDDDLGVLIQTMLNRIEEPMPLDRSRAVLCEVTTDVRALLDLIVEIASNDPIIRAVCVHVETLLVLGRPREALLKLATLLA